MKFYYIELKKNLSDWLCVDARSQREGQDNGHEIMS